MVTAGLKCPPEMWPNAKIAASRPRPNENGTTSRFGVGALAAANAGDRQVADGQEQERADAARRDTHVLPSKPSQVSTAGRGPWP